MAQQDVNYRLTADIADLQSKLSSAQRSLKNLDNVVNEGSQKMTRGFNKAAAANDNLERSLRNTGQAIAVLDGPLGGIASRFVGLATLIRQNGLALGAYTLSITGLGFAFRKAVSAADELQQSQLQLQKLLQATSGASGQTLESIERLAKALGEETLASAGGVRKAASQLLVFQSVANDVFERTLRAAQDLASLGFGSLESQAVNLGRALEDPAENITFLRRSLRFITADQAEYIKQLAESGKLLEAQRKTLEIIEERVSGVAAAQAQTFGGQVDTFFERITTIFEKIGESGPIDIATQAFANLNEALLGVINNFDQFAQTLEGAFVVLGTITAAITANLAISLGVTLVRALVAAKAAMLALNVAILANPFGALARAAIIAGTAIAAYAGITADSTTAQEKYATSLESVRAKKEMLATVTGKYAESLREETIATIDSNIAQLQKSLQPIDQAIADRRAKLESLQQERAGGRRIRGGVLFSQSNAIAELEREAGPLRKVLQDLIKERAELQAMSIEPDPEAGDPLVDKKREEAIKRLAQLYAKTRTEIERLNAQIAEAESLRPYAETPEQIEAIDRTIANARERIAELNKTIVETPEMPEELKQAYKELDAIFRSTRTQSEELRAELMRLAELRGFARSAEDLEAIERRVKAIRMELFNLAEESAKDPFRQAALKDIQEVFESTRTEVERFTAELDRLAELKPFAETPQQIEAIERAIRATSDQLRDLLDSQSNLFDAQEFLTTAFREFGEESSQQLARIIVQANSLEDALQGVISKLTEVALEKFAIAPLEQAFGLVANAAGNSLFGRGGGLSTLFDSSAPVQGPPTASAARGGGPIRAATGAEFTVGGPSGIDKTLVQFLASRGERVSVQRPGIDGSGGRPVNVNVAITTPNPERFFQSQAQVSGLIRDAVSRGSRLAS